MAFKAFGFSIDQHSEQLARDMAAIVTSEPIDVTDLAVFDANISNEDIIFVFGERAARELKDSKPKIRLDFADFHRLDATFGEEDKRQLAYDQLMKLKRAISLGDHPEDSMNPEQVTHNTIIKEESLPELSSYDILQHFKDALSKTGNREWLGNTKDGKLVKITLEKEKGNADINMTFAELFMLKVAMETLRIKELEIVHRPGVNR